MKMALLRPKKTHEYKIAIDDIAGEKAAASIIFVDHKFEKCTYTFPHTTYSLEEWQALGFLAKTIEGLIVEHSMMSMNEQNEKPS